VADFHDGHATAAPVRQLGLNLFENFQGQRGRPRGEIEYAHESKVLVIRDVGSYQLIRHDVITFGDFVLPRRACVLFVDWLKVA
jgi:hypothetical protein